MSDAPVGETATPPAPAEPQPFSTLVFDKENAAALGTYVKVMTLGSTLIILAILSTLSIYWGALWKTPTRNLGGWVVDFDGGLVGQAVVQGLVNGTNTLKTALREHHTWVAVAINPGSTDRLRASYSSPNATYNGTDAMTMYGNEGRNENAYRLIIRPSVEQALQTIETSFATTALPLFAASTEVDIPSVIATSPQTIVKPIGHKLDNVAPFNIPVASAVTFVGLIYVLILSSFVIMTAHGAREASGFERRLTTRSLTVTRLATHFIAELFISLVYSLLSLAFQVDFSRKFGAAGFFIFWMVNYVGMLSVGLVLESLMPVLTPRFISYFLIFWVIFNVSVCIQPIEVLPSIYRYGYAAPFYNISRAMRCVVFADKNMLGLNFGVLFAWMIVAIVVLVVIQLVARRRAVRAYRRQIRSRNRKRGEEKRISGGSGDRRNEEYRV
ncbi:putative protein of unknown function (DUF3533) [Lyophyllum shimeji]|uniref:DUF3533 domain-containing protein n=1 Tax=Lyophyllum shimeji TaxID=47721 RepID=A0A9P3UNB3_LYOSH|nr:putative protein of unknown function (DUF3533) [Lyophyllum shimeji]